MDSDHVKAVFSVWIPTRLKDVSDCVKLHLKRWGRCKEELLSVFEIHDFGVIKEFVGVS